MSNEASVQAKQIENGLRMFSIEKAMQLHSNRPIGDCIPSDAVLKDAEKILAFLKPAQEVAPAKPGILRVHQ